MIQKSFFPVVLVALFHSTQVWGQIAKCTDAEGRTHYGNYASEKCAQSDITHMDGTGTVVGTESRPLTEEELRQKEQKAAEEEKIQQQQATERAEKDRIAAIYDTEDDIARARDNKLETVETQMVTMHSLLKLRKGRLEQVQADLATTPAEATGAIERLTEEQDSLASQIAEYEAGIEEAEQRKTDIHADYERELAIYRDYHNR